MNNRVGVRIRVSIEDNRVRLLLLKGDVVIAHDVHRMGLEDTTPLGGDVSDIRFGDTGNFR